MRPLPKASSPDSPDRHVLLAYVADLELEVDRLRKQDEFVQHAARDTLRQIREHCATATPAGEARQPVADITRAVEELAAVLRDLRETPGYHPARDQVIAIALRPLAERIFRGQQRLLGVPKAGLQLEFESEHVEWFPARLRHILDNLFSNALKYRDPEKAETQVTLGLRLLPAGYELRVSDNGIGMQRDEHGDTYNLFFRTTPAGATGPGVGLAVVKLLVEQSGGALTVDSGEGWGTTFTATLPRFDVDDFLT
jgi:signal transduction histidine kinase